MWPSRFPARPIESNARALPVRGIVSRAPASHWVTHMGRHGRLGSPVGTRANSSSRNRLRTGSLGVLVLLCASFALAIGDETARLTVKNLTPHVVTIVIAEKSYPAVKAGAAVTYTAGDSATVGVTVTYAPDQGVSGSAERSFHIEHAHPASGGGYAYFACAVNAPISSPMIGGPVSWNVTADTLATR